jgi:Fe-S oxidoreductase
VSSYIKGCGAFRLSKNQTTSNKDYKCPAKDVDPENFLENDEIYKLLETQNTYKFSQEFDVKLLDCVHCNACKTSEERCQLNKKFVMEDGNKIDGLEEMIDSIKNFGTPYGTDQMRIKIPEGIHKESKTIYFMGCLSTIRVPRFTEDSLKYLLNQKIDFTILEKEMCCGYPLYVSGTFEDFDACRIENVAIFQKYEKIICCCPACFFVFKTHYPEEISKKTVYITDYLKPARTRKSGKLGIQHLCQLMNRGYPKVTDFIEDTLRQSGYEVHDVPHRCCGGGIGYMHRIDLIDTIGIDRVKDFQDSDYYTTYCVSCWWILYRFGKKLKIKRKIRTPFELLM